ncbi:MAG: hypothetical protein WKG01_13730 [Kofleriaceae bacterium]
MIRAVVALSIVISVTTTSADTPSQRRRLVGILDVQASPEIAASFEKGLEQQLDSKQYWLVPRAKMRERLSNSTRWSEGCLVGPCLSEVRVQTSADLVVIAALTGSGTSFGYVVTVVRTDTGRILSQESERCEICTINEAMTAATLATIQLVTAVPDVLPDDQATARSEAQAGPRRQLRRTRLTGIGLSLTGVVAAGIGTALYLAQDAPDYALALAAAGGGLALGGVLVVTF